MYQVGNPLTELTIAYLDALVEADFWIIDNVDKNRTLVFLRSACDKLWLLRDTLVIASAR